MWDCWPKLRPLGQCFSSQYLSVPICGGGGVSFVFSPSNMNTDQKAQQSFVVLLCLFFLNYMFKLHLIADTKDKPNSEL